MRDQADELRQLVRQRVHGQPVAAPRLVAIASGRNTVGTTTVAVNLAVALAWTGRRVVLVDVDFDHPQVAERLQVDPRYSVADVLSGRRSLHEVLERGPGGIQIAAGVRAQDVAVDNWIAAQQRLLDELRGLGAHAEIILLDVGAALTRVTRGFWHAADTVLGVLTPEPISLMNTYAAIKLLLAERRTPVDVVVNRSPNAAMAKQIAERLALACDRFLKVHIELAGWLPEEEAVAAAGRARQPFRAVAPDCAAAREIDRLAEHLASDGQRHPTLATPNVNASLPTATSA